MSVWISGHAFGIYFLHLGEITCVNNRNCGQKKVDELISRDALPGYATPRNEFPDQRRKNKKRQK